MLSIFHSPSPSAPPRLHRQPWRRRLCRSGGPVFFRVLAVWFPRLLLASSTRIHSLFPRSCASLPPSFTLAAGRLASADWISLLELEFLVFLSLIVSSRSPLFFLISSMRVLFMATGRDSRSLHLLSLDLVQIRSRARAPVLPLHARAPLL